MLTSTKNPRIQRIRKLQNSARTRRKEGVFVIEGVRLVEEAFLAGWHPEFLIYTQSISPRGNKIVRGFASQEVEVTLVADHVMDAASDTQNPQGILALLPLKPLPIPERLDFILILDGLRDPGNLGTIMRTSLAAGTDGVILTPGTVDPYGPKVTRAAMGAHFKLPIQQLAWDEINALVKGHHLTSYLADSAGGKPHYESDFQAPLALILGGEAAGAGNEAAKLAVQHVHIPMMAETESLNAAAAAAVLMFEVLRQREVPAI
jgi:TrmH family RNA methyltransferase